MIVRVGKEKGNQREDIGQMTKNVEPGLWKNSENSKVRFGKPLGKIGLQINSILVLYVRGIVRQL